MKNRAFTAAMILVFLLVSAGWAQDQGREFHWQGKLRANQILEIKNTNGDIDAKSTSGNQAQVMAEKSGPRAAQIKIEVVPSSEGVTICAVYPCNVFGGSSSGKCDSGGHWNSSDVRGNQTKVHFTVLVPQNVRFTGTNVNGGINAEAMHGGSPGKYSQWFRKRIDHLLGRGEHGQWISSRFHGGCRVEG